MPRVTDVAVSNVQLGVNAPVVFLYFYFVTYGIHVNVPED